MRSEMYQTVRPCCCHPWMHQRVSMPCQRQSPGAQVPSALPSLRRLTRLAYAGGKCYPRGPVGWERELLESTAALTALRSLELIGCPTWGGEHPNPKPDSKSSPNRHLHPNFRPLLALLDTPILSCHSAASPAVDGCTQPGGSDVAGLRQSHPLSQPPASHETKLVCAAATCLALLVSPT